MPFFKKKKKEEAPVTGFELPELPSFSEMQQIKEAIKPIPEIQPAPVQPFPVKETKTEMPATRILTQEISEPIEERISPSSAKGPIFVKIDKFKDALANFELIKEKLMDIDGLLKKIKETREKEQEEFDSWEREVGEIKAKIESIDDRLFSRIE